MNKKNSKIKQEEDKKSFNIYVLNVRKIIGKLFIFLVNISYFVHNVLFKEWLKKDNNVL